MGSVAIIERNVHRELATGTLRGILKYAGVAQEQFIENR